MKIWQSFKAKFAKATLSNSKHYWASIDEMPLYFWEKCQEGKLQFVNKDRKPRPYDADVWLVLYNEYLDRYGLGEQLDRYLTQKIHLAKLRLAYIQTNNVFLLNNIDIAQIELNQLDPSKHEGMSTAQVVVHLSKWIGYRIDTRAITVVEFKEMLEEYVRSNKEK